MSQQTARSPSAATGGIAINRRIALGRAARIAAASAGVLAAPSTIEAATISAGDIEVLQELIALELEIGAFFGRALATFTGDDGSSGDRLLPAQPTLTRIWHHDRAHLALLIERLQAAGIAPSSRPIPDPAKPENFAAFLWTAAEQKNASIAAYVDAATALEHPSLRRLAAGILAAEARHAAYLSRRSGEPAFTTETEGLRSTTSLLTNGSQFAPPDDLSGS